MTGDAQEAAVFERIHALGLYHPSTGVLSALCAAAAVIVPRDPAEWNYDDIRTTKLGPIVDQHCFVCAAKDVRLVRHHVVQIQNGGSNHYRNLIAICQHCHAQIHPWLPSPVKGTDFFVPTSILKVKVED